MNTKSTLTRSDYIKYLQKLTQYTSADEDFLILHYFGAGEDHLHNGIKRAYRDFSRTLRGFSKVHAKDHIRETAVDALKQALCALRDYPTGAVDQVIFDQWHQSTCLQLVDIFKEYNVHFYIGQAQQWINMTFKYIFTLGENRIAGFGYFYPFCHVPLGNTLIPHLIKKGLPPLNCTWSKIDQYADYLAIQKWVVNHFACLPMDVEFRSWLDNNLQ